eukprot:TRINITY_DN7300_c0_g1_i1.p1 TRINITY_DN7300_c0_g1~~TRINITY_DN7300_c0_g1_i1.p1  ORF type:complete len:603 (-),score=177.64 TRINITY_DN7300_c0_g1_i1:75-1832(-)
MAHVPLDQWRATVQFVKAPGGGAAKKVLRSVDVAHGTTVAQVARDAPELREGDGTGPLMAVSVNGCVSSLHTTLNQHLVELKPVFLNSGEGRSTYRRSIVFMMNVAAMKEFGKDYLLIAEHPISVDNHAGYVISVNRGELIDEAFITRLSKRMQAVVDANLPITERMVGYQDAMLYFEQNNKPFSRALVGCLNDDQVHVFHCDGHLSPYIRALAPSTGLLDGSTLRLLPDRSAFALLFPPKVHGLTSSAIPDTVEDPVTARVCKDYTAWGRILGAECVGQLNKRIMETGVNDTVMMCEALQSQKIVEIALNLAKLRDKLKLVLIAGPSASGKTTFSSKLTIQLRILGFVPVLLSVDNYYRPRRECVDETGEYDFERLQALRVDLLNDHLTRLMCGEEVDTPIFDFHTGFPKEDKFLKLKLPPNGIIVMEGILCMNDGLTPKIPRENKFKIFLAPLSQLNLDECNFPSHSVQRLLRRINRDFNHRGYSARHTLNRWAPVSKSEEKNILPTMKLADVVFNSALNYETCVLETYVLPLLKTVKPQSEEYNDARSLLQILEYFSPIPHDAVPKDSLIREFIGGSCFDSE